MRFSKLALFLILAFGLVVAACGQLPRPFKSDPGDGAESPLIALQDTVGIVVVPVFGAPPGVAGPLADIMAAELRRANVPATTGSAVKDAHLLEGEANFAPKDSGEGIVTIDWTLTDGKGAVVEKLTTRRVVASDAWQAGSRVGLNALAADAVPRIAKLLQIELPSVAEARRPTIGVVAVDGAPGDGNEALKNAFTAVLKNAGLPVAPDPKLAAIQVFGKVDVTELKEGRDKLVIDWTLRKPDGSEIGSMKQSNTVESGRATARWGPLAYDVTFAMIDSIADILQTIERADDIRLGR